MTEQIIKWFFEHFSLVMFILALTAGLSDSRVNCRSRVAECVFRWTALLALGLTGVYTFIMHAYFPSISAAAIGWSVSPFQYEVAVANLSVGILGILAFRSGYGFRLATSIAASVWLWGDAVGHIIQMLLHHNFSTGNAGSWFWVDILVPVVLWWALVNTKQTK